MDGRLDFDANQVGLSCLLSFGTAYYQSLLSVCLRRPLDIRQFNSSSNVHEEGK